MLLRSNNQIDKQAEFGEELKQAENFLGEPYFDLHWRAGRGASWLRRNNLTAVFGLHFTADEGMAMNRLFNKIQKKTLSKILHLKYCLK